MGSGKNAGKGMGREGKKRKGGSLKEGSWKGNENRITGQER